MYKDLSLKEKAKVIREGVRLGLNSIDDILSLYDEAISYLQGGPIVTPYGQWKYPGRDTIIPSNDITMDNVNYPVLGVSDVGDAKVMMPLNDYKFRGSIVYEHPLQEGGNTKPIFDLWYPTVPKQKNDTSSYDLRRAYNMLPFDELEKFRTINDYHLPSVAYDEKTDTYTFLKRNGHPTLNYELDWYNSGNPDALEFKERYKLDTLSLPWRYVPTYAKGGSIHIDPKNKGKLTETIRRTGKSKYELAHSKNPLTRKRALFAINASHWKHDEGGHLFLEEGQIFKRPQDDLTRRNILTSPILPPKSYYEQFTIPELEPKKPQPLQPLEGTYGNKYSELIPMSDGTYVNNPINKGLQLDWRTHALEFAPFLAIGAGPAIGSTATWLASKPALYNFGRMTLGSEIGGRSVDLASNLFTGNTWGLNVGNFVEGITRWNPNNTLVGLFVTEGTNPGYFGVTGLKMIGRPSVKTNSISNIFGSVYLKPDEFPSVNILKTLKPKLDVENYLNRHRQRIIDKYGEDAYNKIGQFTYGHNDEVNIKKAIKMALWDEYHDITKALNKRLINKLYIELGDNPAFNIGKRAIVVNPDLYKKNFPDIFRIYGDDIALDVARSHEMDHIFNWYKPFKKEDLATSGLFDLSRIDPKQKEYLSHRNNTELSARGSQLKDYFGTNTITGDQLRFAARNYIKDIGLDNNMTDFFNGIKDWDGMAKWISKNSSVIASPFLIGSFLNKKSDNEYSK